MHTALKNLWASVAIDAGAVLDRDRSGAGDLTLETSGLRPADRSRPSDLTLAGWGGAACDYMIDFACVSSTTPTWSNDPRWCIPGIAATEAEHAKLAADRASSAPVQAPLPCATGMDDDDFWADEENEEHVGPGSWLAYRAVRGNNQRTAIRRITEDDEDGGNEDERRG
eukprot:jgi/Tetstr1/428186/TSEL_018237.t1